MASPKTPQELAQAIEDLVSNYINEGSRSAAMAVKRSFSKSVATGTRSTRSRLASADKVSEPRKRRSAEELAELCEKLYKLICAHPGESMSLFAIELDLSVRDLQRPTSKLKAEGRIRSAGERNMTRYFPTVGRRSRGGGS